MNNKLPPKLVVIVGETGSGKTALALEIAQKHNGAIICADSRTIYRGMDIGTAKPTPEEQSLVPHYLLDVIAPDEQFSAAQFKQLAQAAIDEVTEAGRLPILVGGTGLYIDAILYDFQFRDPPRPDERVRLRSLSIPELHAELAARGIPVPLNSQNPRHLQRALETGGIPAVRRPLREKTLVLGLQPNRDYLRQRLTDRVASMFAAGLVDETQRLRERYGDCEALKAPGYHAVRQYLDGQLDLPAAQAAFVQSDLNLAKRQRTWFKRNKDIIWLDDPRKNVDLLTTFLSGSA